MKKSSLTYFLLAVVLAFGWTGCRNDFDVYAAEKEIRVVYCILNPGDSIQYIRLATAFQFEGDALGFAAENDLSLKGKRVVLTGDGHTWEGEEVTGFPKDSDGVFIPTQTVYRFVTDGSGPGAEALTAGERYKLEVGTSDAEDYVFAETSIPRLPQIRGDLNVTGGVGSSRCLPRLFLDRRFNFYWRKLDPVNSFEVRVVLEIEKNGQPETLQWGPSDLFDANRRCNQGSGSICYQFDEKSLLRFFKNSMPEDGTTYTYNTADSCVGNASQLDLLPKSMWFEVTVVDEYLRNYINVNNPKFNDLSAAKPEYTNLQGSIEAVGVFGSINTDLRYAIMRECGEALLGLNGTPRPTDCDW